MKFKTLMLATAICTSLPQFAMADIVLKDADGGILTLTHNASSSKSVSNYENNVFRGYKGLDTITISGENAKSTPDDFVLLFRNTINAMRTAKYQGQEADQQGANKKVVKLIIKNSNLDSIKALYDFIVGDNVAGGQMLFSGIQFDNVKIGNITLNINGGEIELNGSAPNTGADFKKYDAISSIEMKNVKGLNDTKFLNEFMSSFLQLKRHHPEQEPEKRLTITDSDITSVKEVYKDILATMDNFKEVSFNKVNIADFRPDSEGTKYGKNFWGKNAVLTITNAITLDGKVVDIANYGNAKITNLTVTNDQKGNTDVTSYVGIGDYSNFSGLTKMTLQGNLYWADSIPEEKLGRYQSATAYTGQYHGCALCDVKIPDSLKELICNFGTWNYGGMGSTYHGYTGIALDTQNANNALKLTLGKNTAWLVLIEPTDEAVKSSAHKFLTKNDIKKLSDLTTMDSGSYQVKSGCYDFLWVAKEIETARLSKNSNQSDLYALYLNGETLNVQTNGRQNKAKVRNEDGEYLFKGQGQQ